jgi:hypothetical protein
MKVIMYIGLMRILVEMIDPLRIEKRRPSLDAMYDIPFLKEQLTQVGSVLPCDARN